MMSERDGKRSCKLHEGNQPMNISDRHRNGSSYDNGKFFKALKQKARTGTVSLIVRRFKSFHVTVLARNRSQVVLRLLKHLLSHLIGRTACFARLSVLTPPLMLVS
jgi:hypothetical protein